jgi:HAD superfamily hydrolase (TIGR01509 family)
MGGGNFIRVKEAFDANTERHGKLLVLDRQAPGSLIDRYEALLFDLDGTLIDTMPLHYEAYAEALKRRGLRLGQDDFMSAIGEPARKAIPQFLKLAGVNAVAESEVASIHEEKKKIFEHSLETARLATLQAATLLTIAKGRTKLGLVSSGNRSGVLALVGAMKWHSMFDVIISGDDVTYGKPHAEPYLTAAKRLCVDPQKCLVLEDTESGLQSGSAAGMAVLDVRTLRLSNDG